MGYNWEKIFKEKDEKELLHIYSGKSLLDYEAKVYAGLELKNRRYDFKKIEKIHNEMIERLKADVNEFKELKYINSKFFRNQVLETIGLIFFLIILSRNPNEIYTEDNLVFYKILIFIGISGVGIVLAKWRYNRFKRGKQKTIERKIILVKKMSMPYNQ